MLPKHESLKQVPATRHVQDDTAILIMLMSAVLFLSRSCSSPMCRVCTDTPKECCCILNHWCICLCCRISIDNPGECCVVLSQRCNTLCCRILNDIPDECCSVFRSLNSCACVAGSCSASLMNAALAWVNDAYTCVADPH